MYSLYIVVVYSFESHIITIVYKIVQYKKTRLVTDLVYFSKNKPVTKWALHTLECSFGCQLSRLTAAIQRFLAAIQRFLLSAGRLGKL